MKAAYNIGIEAVGVQQSAAIISDADGNVIGGCRLIGEPMLLHAQPRERICQRLMHLLRAVAREAGLSFDELEAANICIGMLGVSSRFDALVELKEAIFGELDLKPRALTLTGDAEIILASHVLAMDGSLIVCGIGSTVLVAKKPDDRMRYGGWGPAIGDEGSGYWIGREAVRAVAREAHERRNDPSVLWQCIDKWLKSPDLPYPEIREPAFAWIEHRQKHESLNHKADPRAALISFANAMWARSPMDWRITASCLTKPVFGAWEQGDPVATDIALAAVGHLARQHAEACAAHGADFSDRPIVLYGGVLNHNKRFREAVIEALSCGAKTPLQILQPSSPGTLRPALGALLFALGNSKGDDLRLPPSDVLERVVRSHNQVTEGTLKND